MVKYVLKEQQIVEAIRMIGFQQDGAEYYNLHDFAKFMDGDFVRLNMSSDKGVDTTISVSRDSTNNNLHVRAGQYLLRFPNGNLTVMNSEEFEAKYMRQPKSTEPAKSVDGYQEMQKAFKESQQEPIHRNSHCPPEFFTNATVIGNWHIPAEEMQKIVNWLNYHLTKKPFNWYQVGNKMVLSMLNREYLGMNELRTDNLQFTEFVRHTTDQFEIINISTDDERKYGLRYTQDSSILCESTDSTMLSIVEGIYVAGYIKLWQNYRDYLALNVKL